jgi:hypothetical protein
MSKQKSSVVRSRMHDEGGGYKASQQVHKKKSERRHTNIEDVIVQHRKLTKEDLRRLCDESLED